MTKLSKLMASKERINKRIGKELARLRKKAYKEGRVKKPVRKKAKKGMGPYKGKTLAEWRKWHRA